MVGLVLGLILQYFITSHRQTLVREEKEAQVLKLKMQVSPTPALTPNP